MFEFLGIFRRLAYKRAKVNASPFSSVRAARKWVRSLPKTSDYDAHHALVEGLERLNADTRGDSITRLKVLQVLEEAGSALQAKIVDQYLRDDGALKFARESLWREGQLFWSQLAAAYLHLFRQLINGPEKKKLRPWREEIILRNLHYTARCVQWEYYRGQHVPGLIWQRLHRIYRMAEICKVTQKKLTVENRPTTCAREYVRTLVLELANPPGFNPHDVHLIVQLLEEIDPLPIPEIKLRANQHTHCVDLSSSIGAEKLGSRWIHGRRLRYLDLSGLTEYLVKRASEVAGREQSLVLRQLAQVINRSGVRRSKPRRRRSGQMWVAEGMESIMAALSGNNERQMDLTSWSLRDEGQDGLGFAIQGEKKLLTGRLLLASSLPGEEDWNLLRVRWARHEDGRTLVGAQYLSRHPKSVVLETDTHSTEVSPRSHMAIFVPLADTRLGTISNLLLPLKFYSDGARIAMRHGNATYTLKLGKIVETHEEDWVRVSFEVLARETINQMVA